MSNGVSASLRWFLVVCALLRLPLGARAQSSIPVLLISIDGFRADYLEKAATPNLTTLATAGVRAEALKPVFPSKTFTNHYTIVTGLLPKHHGIVSNTMYDAQMNAWFRLSDTGAVRNAAWWGGEPIWATAVKQGQRSACFFWPGSEASIGGIQPTYWKPYVHVTPHEERIRQVLEWLELPAAERPSIITLYFSDTDDAGHRFGPDSPELIAAVQKVDSSIGRLLSELAARGLRDQVNIIVVSDHGMAPVDSSRTVYWDDALDTRTVRSIEEGPNLTINAPADSVPVYVERLNRLSPRLKAYANADLPGRLSYTGHPRIPSIVAMMEDGWTVTRRNRRGGYPIAGGTHGYDNAFRSMQAVFIADGPAFKDGARVDTLMNLDIYELLCHLLELKPAPNDGSFERIRTVLKR